jgi:oligopeptide/dipeptide ABC transporter ATP-binding protein
LSVRGRERRRGRAGDTASPEPDLLLDIRELVTVFNTADGVLTAVRGLSYQLRRGEVLGIVGESGSGKSVSALSVLGLLPRRVGQITNGSIRFKGEELTRASQRRLRRLRGREIAMIFQESALDPSYTVGAQLLEILHIHERLSRSEATGRALESLRRVGIADPDRLFKAYPHQLSGGMRQRVMIAIALSCSPELLFADEPTTALDVTIQAQILQLLRDLTSSNDMAMVLVTHDLGVVAESVDRVLVMYAGQVMEEAPVDDLFERPLHPYTEGLLSSTPSLDDEPKSRLRAIPGNLPSPYDNSPGCPFAARCPYAQERCLTEVPLEVIGNRKVACVRHNEIRLVGDDPKKGRAGSAR